ncbi:MAG TPA: ATP-binding protein [Solirubrobacteraceae bacterium]|nr:ATP-binding protein [Solirubrobacteraceae bacterium]
MDVFSFPARDRFVDREADLTRMADWWGGEEANALAVYGRRRVGKSWLLRRFADGKRAVVLVADRRTQAPQLDRFAVALEPLLGLRPALDGIPSLLEALYTLAERETVLAVIDEFPYLLPANESDRDEVLTGIQAVMEERDASRLKLVLCGSYIGQMERLLTGPLRGRLTSLVVDPLDFAQAAVYLGADASAVEKVERYAVAGGMSLYLDELGEGGTLRQRVCTRVLNPRGPLFNDPREVLEEELRSPGVYYSLLEELSTGRKSLADLATALGRRTPDLQGYLKTLRGMQVVARHAPVTAREEERNHRWSLSDGFMRFWFRFVFPYQEDLKTGLAPAVLYREEIEPQLADHVSPTFEGLCRQWVLRTGRATRVGAWWGNALGEHRRTKARMSEEVDVVGLVRSVVAVVGECKWTKEPMALAVLEDLHTYKVPSMREAKIRFAKDGPHTVLFSRGGFRDELMQAAEQRGDVTLISVEQLVGELEVA